MRSAVRHDFHNDSTSIEDTRTLFLSGSAQLGSHDINLSFSLVCMADTGSCTLASDVEVRVA